MFVLYRHMLWKRQADACNDDGKLDDLVFVFFPLSWTY